jgi:hypothetical protein
MSYTSGFNIVWKGKMQIKRERVCVFLMQDKQIIDYMFKITDQANICQYFTNILLKTEGFLTGASISWDVM